MNLRPRLIAGPTAGGKSDLALRLAESLGGEVVNADSMQIYRDLRVLTARPSPEAETRVPHHLYGVGDGAAAWSVGRWLSAAAQALAEIAARGRTAVIVGGTGLYFRALTIGLSDMPPVSAEIRQFALDAWAADGERAFRARLAAVDPAAAARIAPGDRQRLTRAWEVWVASGRPLSDWQAGATPLLAPGSFEALVVEPPRAELHARCDARAAAMLRAGAVEEVARLVARGLSSEAPVMKALGVAPLAAMLRREIDEGAALETLRRDTRRYAKRQSTWFRHQTPDWPRSGGD